MAHAFICGRRFDHHEDNALGQELALSSDMGLTFFRPAPALPSSAGCPAAAVARRGCCFGLG